MEKKFLTRQYLETLSSADLMDLADDYDIDVPADLNRRFIIGELLEVAEELKASKDSDMIISSESVSEESADLPKSYNETFMNVVLRNPAWAFVYWDISENDRSGFTPAADFRALVLRVSFFADEDSAVPEESFDVQIDASIREQYVLFPAGKNLVRIDLVVQYQSKPDSVLAYTQKYVLPQGSRLLSSALPGHDVEISEIAALSSLKDLLKEHYQNHRQSFLS